MKIHIVRVEPTTQISGSGKKKYYAYTSDGDRHIAWGDWVEQAKGQDVDVTLKEESFKGNDYTVIWPTNEESQETAAPAKERAVASEIAVRPKINLPSTQTTATTNRIDRRDRMMAKESALKSATQVWSTKVTAGLDGKGQEDPLEMAKRFYEWILQE